MTIWTKTETLRHKVDDLGVQLCLGTHPHSHTGVAYKIENKTHNSDPSLWLSTQECNCTIQYNSRTLHPTQIDESIQTRRPRDLKRVGLPWLREIYKVTDSFTYITFFVHINTISIQPKEWQILCIEFVCRA